MDGWMIPMSSVFSVTFQTDPVACKLYDDRVSVQC